MHPTGGSLKGKVYSCEKLMFNITWCGDFIFTMLNIFHCVTLIYK